MINKYWSLVLVIACIVVLPSCNNASYNDKAVAAMTPDHLILNSRACYFDDTDSSAKRTEIKTDSAGGQEIEQINTIMRFTGLPQNFKVYRGNIKTAMATMIDGQRVIIYNKDLLTAKHAMDNSYWSALFIIAHEIGHHLAYNISDTANVLNAELEADAFAGSILYNMGADSNQVISTFASGIITNKEDTRIHPSKAKRIAAVKQSWLRAAKMRYQQVVPPSVEDELAVKEFTERNLIFNAIGHGYLYEYFKEDDDKEKIINYFDPVRNIQGTILDVKKIRSQYTDADTKKVTQLKMSVLVTHIDRGYQNEDFRENQRYQYEVFYEPKAASDRMKDFYDFFKAGRRFRFDVINMYKGLDEGGEVLTIIKAKAL